jgi:hypothetical protein
MNRAEQPRPGDGPDDVDLGRLIAEGLRREVGADVDERLLVAGAQRGAVRIRRRRNLVAAAVAAVVVAGAPLGSIGIRMLAGQSDSPTATSAGAPVAVAAAEGAATAPGASRDGLTGQAADQKVPVPVSPFAAGDSGAAAGSAAATVSGAPNAQPGAAPAAGGPAVKPTGDTAVPMSTLMATLAPTVGPTTATSIGPRESTSGSAGVLARTATGPIVIPSAAMLGAPDLSAAAARLEPSTSPGPAVSVVADSANRQSAPATSAATTCGQSLAGLPPGAAGSRGVTFQRKDGTSASSGWVLSSTVRVYPGAGAAAYLAAAVKLRCAVPVPIVGLVGDGSAITSGRPDAHGRIGYYAVVRSGRTITEIALLIPAGVAGQGIEDVARLMAIAADRLNRSGLAAAASADPALAS